MTLTFIRTRSASWSNRFRPSPLDDNVGALDVAEVSQARPQCLDTTKFAGKAPGIRSAET